MHRICILLQVFIAFDTWTALANQRCYVCIPNTGSSISDVLQMFPESESNAIPLCNQFQPNNSVYVRDCPSAKYQGCLTQTNGTHVTKTCTEVGLEDCKTANKIKYCYCKDDLCNEEDVPTEAPVPVDMESEDDEDSILEGSGSYEELDHKPMKTTSVSDVGIELVHKQQPTTTTVQSVILTTSRPEDAGTVKAKAANLVAQPVVLFCLISYHLSRRY